MVFNALFKSIATFLEKKLVQMQEKIRSVDERSTHWHLRSANSASIRSLAIQWRRLGAGMQRLASAVRQLQNEGGGEYWQTKAFQTSRLSPNSHLFLSKMTTYGFVYREKSVKGEGDARRRP